MKDITILIPTYKRTTALAVTLTTLLFQFDKNFMIIISDQNEDNTIFEHASFQNIIRLLRNQDIPVIIKKHLPRLGIAEQRQFLLDHSQTKYVLFLDDDLILEPYVIKKMKEAIEKEKCGFVARAPIGLSYQFDIRPDEQMIEFWEGNVQPETITPQSKKWKRYKLHNAANLLHLEKKYKITEDKQKKYKISWAGGCVLYNRNKLKKSNGFTFWKKLPTEHVGEDVMTQLEVMKRYGGCGLLPSGVYHQELTTTLKNREINAPEFLLGTN